MLSSYQPFQFPALFPATRSSAQRTGSKARALDPIGQRPPEARAFPGEHVDHFFDPVRGDRVLTAQLHEPLLGLAAKL